MACLVCHWELNEPKDGDHLPDTGAMQGGVYVCADCVTRMKTVSSFGLTVEELKNAAVAYKKAEQIREELGPILSPSPDCADNAKGKTNL